MRHDTERAPVFLLATACALPFAGAGLWAAGWEQHGYVLALALVAAVSLDAILDSLRRRKRAAVIRRTNGAARLAASAFTRRERKAAAPMDPTTASALFGCGSFATRPTDY